MKPRRRCTRGRAVAQGRHAIIPDGESIRDALTKMCGTRGLVPALLILHSTGRSKRLSLKAAFVMAGGAPRSDAGNIVLRVLFAHFPDDMIKTPWSRPRRSVPQGPGAVVVPAPVRTAMCAPAPKPKTLKCALPSAPGKAGFCPILKDTYLGCQVVYEDILTMFNRACAKVVSSFTRCPAILDSVVRQVAERNRALGRPETAGADIIYADPPWRYRRAQTPYRTMSTEELMAMDVPRLCGDRPTVLLMWSTGAKLTNESAGVLEAWGFTFVTVFAVWVKRYPNGKVAKGVGSHTRPCCEYLLLGRRGSIGHLYNQGVRRCSSQLIETFDAGSRPHSEKPAEARQLIDRIFSRRAAPVRVELFSRHDSDGWIGFGDQVGMLSHKQASARHEQLAWLDTHQHDDPHASHI